MHGRTKKKLLGLGFDTDLIEAIDKNHHTVDALRSLASAALRKSYTEEQATLIEAKIKRTPIPENVVASVLVKAGECCCYCADGNSSRPYQIHHIDPYAATQNHAEENLLLVCPTHHVVIHERKLLAAEQKRVRSEWQATVELAEAYKACGISFPYGSFVPVDFAGVAKATELVRDFRVTPATALAVSRHDLAAHCKALLLKDRRAVVVGRSGDGKSTLALGVAGLLHEEGSRVFRYRPPVGDNRGAVREVLTHLGVVVRDSILVLDDVNAWASPTDLGDILVPTGCNAAVIATWTQDAMSEDPRVMVRFPQWVSLSWDRIAPAVKSFLQAHEAEVVSALRALDPAHEPGRVGLGFMDRSLEDRIRRYEEKAKTVSEFLFLLRGGADVVAKELAALARNDRADVPVLYAAIEQIADFERHVSLEETAAACAGLAAAPGLPPLTAAWVREVFEAQCAHRRMQKSRGAYSTIHRDWARRLIYAAFADARSRDAVTRLLLRDFDFRTSRPRRLLLLWSWLMYDPHGTPFVREWAARQKPEDWAVLVETAAHEGLEDLGLLASQLHIFFQSEAWRTTVGQAFAKNAALIAEKVGVATATDWPALRWLFTAMEHACPEVVTATVQHWAPAKAATAFSATRPDYYLNASWFFSGVAKYDRAWCEEVGRALSWDEISQNLDGVSKGDVDTVEECCSILQRLHVPLRRSMIRRYAEVMRDALRGASLYELHPGFGNDLSVLLQLFPGEVEALASALDPARLGRELSVAPPRYWRVLGELATFLRSTRSGVYERVVGHLDRPKFLATVSAYGPSHPYELRCLVWLLRNGSEKERAKLASSLFDIVRAAAAASDVERPTLLEAFSYLDQDLAARMAKELNTELQRSRTLDDRPLEDRSPGWRKTQEQLRALDEAGDDYEVGPFTDAPVDQVRAEEAEAWDEPPPA